MLEIKYENAYRILVEKNISPHRVQKLVDKKKGIFFINIVQLIDENYSFRNIQYLLKFKTFEGRNLRFLLNNLDEIKGLFRYYCVDSLNDLFLRFRSDEENVLCLLSLTDFADIDLIYAVLEIFDHNIKSICILLQKGYTIENLVKDTKYDYLL